MGTTLSLFYSAFLYLLTLYPHINLFSERFAFVVIVSIIGPMLDTREIWNSCLQEIEINVSKANFNTWFKNTYITKEDSGTIYVSVPNEFVKEWLYTKYHKLILKVLMNHSQVRSVEYIISKINISKSKGGEESPIYLVQNKELPIKDIYIITLSSGLLMNWRMRPLKQ